MAIEAPARGRVGREVGVEWIGDALALRSAAGGTGKEIPTLDSNTFRFRREARTTVPSEVTIQIRS